MTLRLRASALLVEFDGPLSCDDDVRFAVYESMCAVRGRTLRRRDVDRLATDGDEAVFRFALGASADVERLAEEREWRYQVAVAAGATVSDGARHAVLFAAAWVPVLVLAAAPRREVLPILQAALLDGVVAGNVCADDVAQRKPAAEAYRTALELAGVDARDAVAVEATATAAEAARAAGISEAVVSVAPLTPSSVAPLLLG